MPPRKQEPPPPPPPTYPARPMNGGKLELAEPLDPDQWRYRPKWNGRRCLVHMPTMRTWNRELEMNNWTFPAFEKLREIVYGGSDLWPQVLEWLDVELLYGKTSIGKRSIVVLDYVNPSQTWLDRQLGLELAFKDRLISVERPADDEVYFAGWMGQETVQKAWDYMQEANAEWGATLYEGLVAYDINSQYPIQLFSPKKETRHWIKYRFVN